MRIITYINKSIDKKMKVIIIEVVYMQIKKEK